MKVIPERLRGEVVSKTAAPVPSVRVMDVNVLVEVNVTLGLLIKDIKDTVDLKVLKVV